MGRTSRNSHGTALLSNARKTLPSKGGSAAARVAMLVAVALLVAAVLESVGIQGANGGLSARLATAQEPSVQADNTVAAPNAAPSTPPSVTPPSVAPPSVTPPSVTPPSVAAPASQAVRLTIDPNAWSVGSGSSVAESSVRNVWLLVSSVLVLTMVAPGLAMFYGGLVRKKNVLGVIMQCVFLLGLMPTLWGLYGYSLAFGRGGPDRGPGGGANTRPPTGGMATESAAIARNRPLDPVIGDFSHVGMRGVQPRWSAELGRPVSPLRAGVPVASHMLFHGMLFTVAAAVISGAFAERMRFVSFALFAALWGTVVYCPLCHWIWDGGLLARGSGWAGGAIDFAGGTAIHVSAGVSALVCALVMGKRLGHGNEPMPPHNLTYTTLGAALLWAGWFGFNAGRASEHDGVLSMPMAATQFAAAAGTLAWAGAEWWTRGRPSVLGACSGAVAGLVCVTPAAGYIELPAALAMGLAAGLACCFACNRLKTALGYDDSLDAFGVHGVGGAIGMALTGVFATRNVADPAISLGAPLGLVDGSAGLIAGQLVAVGVAAVYSAVATFILLKLLDTVLGLRVTHDEEIQGLDVSQHGEEGYIFL